MTAKYLEYKTQLQIVREQQGITVRDMAQGVINLHNNRSNSLDIEDLGHIERVIQHIESRGKIPCPRPRKTYELKAIAKWMTEITGIKYLPEHIMENIK